MTRAQQREATKASLLDAAVQTLVDEGYRGLTTRRVADRAGVAQSTLMHHFPSRDVLLTETITNIAVRLAADAVDEIDLAALREPAHRHRVLDQAWRQFTSREALAAAQLWAAAVAEPELAATLRGLEDRLNAIISQAARLLIPGGPAGGRFPAMIDGAVALIRGLVIEIPIWGREAIDARWEQIKPLIVEAAAQLLD
jgi:AcrR family transcriptional regulator